MSEEKISKWQRHRLKDLEGYRERKREYAKTPEQRMVRAAYMRKWREENREKFNRQARESHQRNKHKHVNRNREIHLKRKFGITLQDKVSMINAQDGKCAICGREFQCTRSTHVDHCHKSKAIRGILCQSCNTKLGWFEAFRDNIVSYLE